MIKILCKIWITLKLNINVLHFLQHIWFTEKLSRWYKVFLYTFTLPHHGRVSPIINIFTATAAAAAAAKSLQLCPTLCDPYGSPPGSPVPGILQARTLEWVAISFFNAWKWKVKVKLVSHVWPSATPWTAAFQAPPSRGFSRQEYWSGVPLPLLWYICYKLVNQCWYIIVNWSPYFQFGSILCCSFYRY